MSNAASVTNIFIELYLAVVSVECLQLLDIIHADALRQRLGAQVRSGKLRQGVGRICMKEKSRQVSLISVTLTHTDRQTDKPVDSGDRNHMKTTNKTPDGSLYQSDLHVFIINV